MKRCLLLVEGQTEEVFVRDHLDPHLHSFGKTATAVLLKTKREKSGRTFRGGVSSWGQILGDLQRLLRDSAAAIVTTLIDYYALPADVPGMHSRPVGDCFRRVGYVEQEMARTIQNHRFLPHLTLHEFEAWLYVKPESWQWLHDVPRLDQQLSEIRRRAGGAEMIDEQPVTAPSKQLLARFPDYEKTLHGPMAVQATGLSNIRAACGHFEKWLRALEAV